MREFGILKSIADSLLQPEPEKKSTNEDDDEDAAFVNYILNELKKAILKNKIQNDIFQVKMD